MIFCQDVKDTPPLFSALELHLLDGPLAGVNPFRRYFDSSAVHTEWSTGRIFSKVRDGTCTVPQPRLIYAFFAFAFSDAALTALCLAISFA